MKIISKTIYVVLNLQSKKTIDKIQKLFVTLLREGYWCLEKYQVGQIKLFIAYLLVICKGILVAKFHDPPSTCSEKIVLYVVKCHAVIFMEWLFSLFIGFGQFQIACFSQKLTWSQIELASFLIHCTHFGHGQVINYCEFWNFCVCEFNILTF